MPSNDLLAALTGDEPEEEEREERKTYDWRREPFLYEGKWYHLAAVREPAGTYYVVTITDSENGQGGHANLLHTAKGHVLIIPKPSKWDELQSALEKAALRAAQKKQQQARS